MLQMPAKSQYNHTTTQPKSIITYYRVVVDVTRYTLLHRVTPPSQVSPTVTTGLSQPAQMSRLPHTETPVGVVARTPSYAGSDQGVLNHQQSTGSKPVMLQLLHMLLQLLLQLQL